jgi:acyl dehydratase
MHPYGCDEIFAADEGIFGRRLVAGALIFSVGIGMVATNWWQAFSYGYDRLRFIKPVFFGDTIYTIRTNIHKEPKYEKRGLTKARYDIYKGEGEIVLSCEHIQTVLYRDPEAIKVAVKAEK